MKALHPPTLACIAYTGDLSSAASFRRVLSAADYSCEVPTRNTKDNWYGLDRALLHWWVYQGQCVGLKRILFVDWDVLFLGLATCLLNQLSQGRALSTHVFPVLGLDVDHWARELAESNSTSERLQLCDDNALTRAFLF